MQNNYATIMNLHKGFFPKNAEFSCALDRRQTDTLSLIALFVQNLQLKFVNKLNPYFASLQKQNKGFSVFIRHAEVSLLSI